MLARDVMSRDVVTVGSNARLLEAVKLLINAHISGLPVIDESGAIVGMLSEFDVIRHVVGSDAAALSRFQSQLDDHGVLATAYSHALSEPVKSIMVTPPLTAPGDAELKVVAGLMLEHGVKRVPIVTGTSVVGIVSRADLLKALLSRPEEVAAAGGERPPGQLASVSDDQLRHDVIRAVRLAGVQVTGGFDVVSHNGVAHLWGVLADESMHEACRAAALRVPGVSDLVSHMQVVPMRNRGFFPRWQ